MSSEPSSPSDVDVELVLKVVGAIFFGAVIVCGVMGTCLLVVLLFVN